MLGAVAREVANHRANLRQFPGCEARREIELVADAQAEQALVEMPRDLRVGHGSATLTPKWPRRRTLKGRAMRTPPTVYCGVALPRGALPGVD